MSAHTDQTEAERDALEHEIEQARESLVDTVDAIVERVDPRQVAARTSEQAKRDVHRRVDRARGYVQEDPVRTAAIAGGVIGTLITPVLAGRFADRRRRRRLDRERARARARLLGRR